MNFSTNSHVISKSNTFSIIFGMRDHLFLVILQFEVKNMVKNDGVNFLEQFKYFF